MKLQSFSILSTSNGLRSLAASNWGWGAEWERSRSELDFSKWRRVGAERIKAPIRTFQMHKMHNIFSKKKKLIEFVNL